MQSKDSKLQQVIELIESSKHSSESKDELNKILREDQRVRQEVSFYLTQEVLLKQELKSRQIESIVADERIFIQSRQEQNATPFKKIISFAAVAVAAVLVTLGITSQLSEPSDFTQPITMDSASFEKDEGWIAKIHSQTAITQWEDKLLTAGSKLTSMRYDLTKGAAILHFSKGVELIIESPASFEIIDHMELKLHRGNVRAKVAETAHGFVIDTPQPRIRDLGTEFGVSVAEDSTTEVHVFNGEVELYEDGDVTPELVQDGFAARWSHVAKGQPKSREKISFAQEIDFLSFSEINYNNWLGQSREWSTSPDTLVYYDFTRDILSPDTLFNRNGDSSADGKINRPIWVQGRWENKGALLFESGEDWIEATIPPTEESWTILTWIKPERYDTALGVIIDSDQWADGRHHLQLTNDGYIRAGVGGFERPRFCFTSSGPKVLPGVWTQLVVAYDQKEGLFSYYVNDQLAHSKKHTKGLPVNIGRAHIGAWITGGKPERGFRGRMDELLILSRALSAQEIQAQYNAHKNN